MLKLIKRNTKHKKNNSTNTPIIDVWSENTTNYITLLKSASNVFIAITFLKKI